MENLHIINMVTLKNIVYLIVNYIVAIHIKLLNFLPGKRHFVTKKGLTGISKKPYIIT